MAHEGHADQPEETGTSADVKKVPNPNDWVGVLLDMVVNRQRPTPEQVDEAVRVSGATEVHPYHLHMLSMAGLTTPVALALEKYGVKVIETDAIYR